MAKPKSRTCKTCNSKTKPRLTLTGTKPKRCYKCLKDYWEIGIGKTQWQPKPKPGKVFLDMEVKVDKTLPKGTITMENEHGKELIRMVNVGHDKPKPGKGKKVK